MTARRFKGPSKLSGTHNAMNSSSAESLSRASHSHRPLTGPQAFSYTATAERNDAHSYRSNCHCSGCHTFRLIRERQHGAETEFRNHAPPSYMVEKPDTESDNDSSTGSNTDLGPSYYSSSHPVMMDDRSFQMSFNTTQRSPSPDIYVSTLPVRSPFHSSYGSLRYEIHPQHPSTDTDTPTLSAIHNIPDRHPAEVALDGGDYTNSTSRAPETGVSLNETCDVHPTRAQMGDPAASHDRT
ncbi:hypothetical protein BT96DRAFT_1008270 [Gymnopus androsaceus JB14]|uniref:Uncharacterized protein n=1 Tax=Gymnopus androsaceus JB14 TaxID=1447944 RepID=A0A6A4GG20_9AGAR|nr:hypothetical protein BT96DRAFT_1008270 [Gymnopus androsaceus JB14]